MKQANGCPFSYMVKAWQQFSYEHSSCRKLTAGELASVFLVTAEPLGAISVANLQASLPP